jgi:hypothetical protein
MFAYVQKINKYEKDNYGQLYSINSVIFSLLKLLV